MELQPINSLAMPSSAGTQTPVRSKSATSLESGAPLQAQHAAQQQPVSEVQLQSAVKAANAFVQPINSAIEFSVDKDTDSMVVKVVDTVTKEVIRQIPSEEMLVIAKALDQIQGLLIKQKA